MKKLVLGGIIGVVLVMIVVVVILRITTANAAAEKKRISDASVALSDTVIKFQRGIDETSQLDKFRRKLIPEIVVTRVSDYNNSLKALNSFRFNITDYYNNNFKGDGTSAAPSGGDGKIADDPKGVVAPSYDASKNAVPDDSRLVFDAGVAYMSLKSFDFSNDTNDIVAYNGVNMVIPKENVPESYDSMIKNAEYFYNYVTTKEGTESGKKFVDVLYQSIKSGNSLIVRVFNDGHKVIDFEVRK